MNPNLPTPSQTPALPPNLAGRFTLDVKHRVESVYFSATSCFDFWVKRRRSRNTQSACREDVMAFVDFLGISWPENSWEQLSVSIKDVLAFRDQLIERGVAPKRSTAAPAPFLAFVNTCLELESTHLQVAPVALIRLLRLY